jgi:hypothetical protein
MGNQETGSQLVLYGSAEHPIDGSVEAYMMQNEPGRFVMRLNMRVTREQLQLFKKVDELKNPKMLRFFGVENGEEAGKNPVIRDR